MADEPWTDDELAASVDAYLEMWHAEQAGTPYVKAEIRRKYLEGPLSGRSAGSFEMRMANISHVFLQRGLEYVEGYKPRSNVGTERSSQFANIIDARLANSAVSDAYTAEDAQGLPEGALRLELVNRYERRRANRSKCIDHHGDACAVCERRMGEIYGEFADGYIHVHHVVPVSQIGPDYKIDPITDLIPVCPNCHAMLHRGRGATPRSVAELRAELRLDGAP